VDAVELLPRYALRRMSTVLLAIRCPGDRRLLLHAAVGDVAGIASGGVGVFVAGCGVPRACGNAMCLGWLCGVAMHGGAGHGGPWNIDVRHCESGRGSGRCRERLFRKGLRGQDWSGEEQRERRDSDETRNPHDGTWRGRCAGEINAATRVW
jgi:hypothetical protein